MAGEVSKLIQNDASGNPIYVGSAPARTGTNQALWTIAKMTYDGSNNVTAVQYAIDNYGQINNSVWDNRASLTYA